MIDSDVAARHILQRRCRGPTFDGHMSEGRCPNSDALDGWKGAGVQRMRNWAGQYSDFRESRKKAFLVKYDKEAAKSVLCCRKDYQSGITSDAGQKE